MNAKLIAIVTDKKNGFSSEYRVMEMHYKISNNVLWITDHRGIIRDFDLNEFTVIIKNLPTSSRQ